MSRQARRQSSMDYYHVMIREINREFIFKSDKQKEKFIDLMKLKEKESFIRIGVWCIMDNHVHLLLKANLTDMSKAIKIICIKYAAYYNKTLNRIGSIGSVFGDRYKNENIEDNAYQLV